MSLQEQFNQIPVVTKSYISSCVVVTALVQLEIISPFQIYFNPDLILKKWEIWRLVTNFCYFGTVGFNFMFNMIFLYRYSRMLEEGSFRGRTSDYVFMFLFGGVLMSLIGLYVNLVFLGQAFTILLVYVWSRRNPYIRLSFFGMMTFRAPYLPWVLIGFSILLGNPIMVDCIGVTCGHIYYFLEDVFPQQEGGFKILNTPGVLKYLFDEQPDDDRYVPLPEADMAGGLRWQAAPDGDDGDEEEEGDENNNGDEAHQHQD